MATAVALALLPAVATPRSTVRLIGPGGAVVYKPGSYCPGNHTCFRFATWRWWGVHSATAKAFARTTGSGRTVTGRITFQFDRPRKVCGGLFFTRARWHYSPSAPLVVTTVVVRGGRCAWTGR